MKRLGNTWSDICSEENIRNSILMVVKNPENIDELVETLKDDLINETYSFGPYKEMIRYEPKKRIIHYPINASDKIYHKCLLNVVGPYLISKLPDESYASIKGRGLTKAVRKIFKFVKEHPDWYFMQADISKFYDNMDHDVLKSIIRRYLKCQKTLKLIDAIIDSFPNGVPIGNHTSQYFANIYLSLLGHKIKEKYGVKFMIIYMDDFLFMFPNKEEANKFKEIFVKEINELKLTIKNNIRVAPVSYGIDMLGYKFYPNRIQLRKRIKLRMIKKLKKAWKLNDKDFKQQMASYYGWCSHADCKKLLKKHFKHRYILFEFKKLSDCGFFGLNKSQFVSITELYDKEIGFLDCDLAKINNQDKLIIKFVYLDDQENPHYTITRSKVIADRLQQDKSNFPFIATFKNTGKYSYYE